MTVLCMSLLCTMAHIPSLILRYVPFKEKIGKKQRNQLFFCYAIGLLVSVLLYFQWEKRIGVSVSFYKINLLLFCIVMGVVNLLVIRGYVKEQLFTFGLTALLILIIFAVAAYLADQIGYDTIPQGLMLENGIGLLLYALGYPWMRKLMRSTVTPFLEIDSRNYWNTVWSLPIAIFLGSVFSYGGNEYTATPVQLISRLFIGLATVLLCRSIARDYKRLQEQSQLELQIEQQKGYYQALTEAVKVEREARHNFKHQLAAMQGFLETGNKEELQKYCDVTQKKLSKVTEIPHTGNAAADAVLYHYACLAKEKNIDFSACCLFEGLTVSDTDLGCLLGNALDNALTACGAFSGERYIRIAGENDENMLVITVDNSFDGVLERDGEKILSKKRAHEEGIGLRSMRQICEKYGGTSEFHAEGNRFEASFLLMAK